MSQNAEGRSVHFLKILPFLVIKMSRLKMSLSLLLALECVLSLSNSVCIPVSFVLYKKQTAPTSTPNSWWAPPISTGAMSTMGRREVFWDLYSMTVLLHCPVCFCRDKSSAVRSLFTQNMFLHSTELLLYCFICKRERHVFRKRLWDYTGHTIPVAMYVCSWVQPARTKTWALWHCCLLVLRGPVYAWY